jgi:hypothetical protein
MLYMMFAVVRLGCTVREHVFMAVVSSKPSGRTGSLWEHDDIKCASSQDKSAEASINLKYSVTRMSLKVIHYCLIDRKTDLPT